MQVGRGVAQGSILGPLLYTIYKKYIQFYNIANIIFTDNTQLYYYMFFNKNYELECIPKINADISALLSVSTQHNLIINSDKSAVLSDRFK